MLFLLGNWERCKVRIAFFCTGDGSFLKFIYLNRALLNGVEEIFLLCDRDCGIYRFLQYKIPCKMLDRVYLGDVIFEKEAVRWLEGCGVDYVFLSCNHILRYDLLWRYGEEKRLMFNCHPALLPKYVGMYAVERSFKSGDRVYGATIHYVTKEVDLGMRIARCVLLKKDKDFKEYAHRLFVNQAMLFLEFVYRLTSGRGGGAIHRVRRFLYAWLLSLLVFKDGIG